MESQISSLVGRAMDRVVSLRQKLPTDTPAYDQSRSERELASVIRSAGVPARYARASLDDFTAALVDDLDWSRGGFFLHGNPGIGKTHLAAALAISRLTDLGSIRDSSLAWVSAPELLMKIRSTFGSTAKESESDVVCRYTSPRILVLDDLGAEKITDWSASTMYLILSKRDAELRDTIITSNASIGDIAKWEPRIASRLASMATVDLPDSDRRLQSRKGA